jgi:ketosteroid isomerase-like protein
MSKSRCLAFLLLLPACAGAGDSTRGTPRALVDSLLDVDRAFARAAADTNAVSGVAAMFSPSVMLRVPGEELTQGKERVVAALETNPANFRAHLTWEPVRGGVSADGQQGFTFGYMQATNPDSTVTQLKYLAYWVREADGWRVRAYRRAPRPGGTPSSVMFAPALPPRLVAVSADSATIRRYADELDRAERAFSDEAQTIGLGPAFAKYGSADAMNFGGPGDTTFVMSAAAIGGMIGAGDSGGSPVSWAPEHVVVASSGDLGVTIGFIVPNAPRDSTTSPAGPRRFPFFTVWRRDSTSQPWKYVAE